MLAGTAALALGVPAPAYATTTVTSAHVVKVADRSPYGDMLTNVRGLSLYFLPTGTCTGSCLKAWPPVLMPKGTTVPLGAKCLATAKFGARLQVKYRHKLLYTFVGDSGTSVNGNGVSGFQVAKIAGTCT